jgi:hypothetical protein
VIAALLIVGALTLVVTNYKQVHEINIFAFVLVVQSLPFVAAVALAAIEGTRFNSFAYWRGIEARIESKAADLLPQSQQVITNVMASNVMASNVMASNVMASNVMASNVMASNVMAEPPKLPADNIEAAQ